MNTPVPSNPSGAHSVAPTRALFAYHRDDQTPDHLTTVSIDVSHKAAAPISPLLFGNFIEHLGGVVYEGLWAQALLNPNLEKIDKGDTAPPTWKLNDRAMWVQEGYHSPLCVRLLPAAFRKTEGEKNASASVQSLPSSTAQERSGGSNNGAFSQVSSLKSQISPSPLLPFSPSAFEGGALSQPVRLPLHRTLRYIVHLYARAVQGEGRCIVALADPNSGRHYADAPLIAADSTWRSFQMTLMLSQEALTAGPELRFEIAHQQGGGVEVDQIELFPDDSRSGIDADVLRKARAWHIPVLRWPGGNFASGYHWQDGIGLRADRPTRPNEAWGGIEPNHFGTDEFLTFCRELGALPQITVNAGDGTPDEAAAWVRYCNASSSDRYGRMRAENGATQPYHVKLWEIGNELYGDWQIGHTDAQGNAARFVRFRDAMRQADPNIKLIATGKGEEFTPEGVQRDLAWNRSLLQTAAANGGQTPDYLSIHPLVPLPSLAGKASYEQQYESAMAHPAFLDEVLLPDLVCLIQSIEGARASTRIAVTEWGIIIGGAGWRNSPNHDSLAGAIFNALTLNTMLRHSDWVTLANMTAFMHGGGIKKWNGVVYVDPQYYTQQLYAAARPHTPVEAITTGPGRDVPARGGLPPVKDVPDIDTFAALTQDGKHLVVFAVNRDLASERPLRLQLCGFQARSVSATLLTAPSPRAGNAWNAPDNVKPTPFTVPRSSDTPGAWQVTLPPHSLVVFTFAG